MNLENRNGNGTECENLDLELELQWIKIDSNVLHRRRNYIIPATSG
jgi:hypothetical protein